MLTETGKNLMLRKVAIQEQDRLKVLGKQDEPPGLRLGGEISTLGADAVRGVRFRTAGDGAKHRNRPLLNAKLEDLQVLDPGISCLSQGSIPEAGGNLRCALPGGGRVCPFEKQCAGV